MGKRWTHIWRVMRNPDIYGLRVNTAKISVEEFRKICPFEITPIPWIENGFYYDIDDMDEAIKYYTLAIEGGYKDAKVFSRLAMAFWERDYVENAIEFYNRAIDIEPDYEIAYNNLGVVYFDGLNDAERAKPCFEAALKLNDNYTMAHFNMAR